METQRSNARNVRMDLKSHTAQLQAIKDLTADNEK
jgi:hypothetical protein